MQMNNRSRKPVLRCIRDVSADHKLLRTQSYFESIAIRDVLEWLRSYGSGYSTRMNAILRRVMEAR